MLNWQKQLWFVVFIMFRLKMLQSLVNQTYAPTHLLLAVELQELRLLEIADGNQKFIWLKTGQLAVTWQCSIKPFHTGLRSLHSNT